MKKLTATSYALLGLLSRQERSAYELAQYSFCTIAAYIISQRYAMVTATSEVEHIIHRLRTRISERVASSELETINEIGATRKVSNMKPIAIAVAMQ